MANPDKNIPGKNDQKTIQAANAVLTGKSKKGVFRRLLPFLGPAFIASVAYVDPGNFATNIAGGAKFGYMLLWVVVASNIMAMLIQTLSAKLGIASGKNLAEQCRINFPKPFVWFLWILMELVAMATDLAEFVGAALGFNLLLGIPLWLAGILAAIATFVILGLERFGFRPLEAVISAFVGVIAISYVIETILVRPDWKLIGYHAVVPQFNGVSSLVMAAGILGATIMPHAIFLHSALTQNRVVVHEPAMLKKLYKYEIIDVLIAMGVASLVNGAMMIMAAKTFFSSGHTEIGTIQAAHLTLQPLLGPAAGIIFAIALLASGLSSASVGTMAGQVIMQGFLHKEIPVWIRRLVTMVPSMIVIFLGLDATKTLVISQVLLSFGLPFTIIPLVIFTCNPKIMGVLVNKRFTTVLASLVAALVVVLNIFLLFSIFTGG
jgi:manganese transport protein